MKQTGRLMKIHVCNWDNFGGRVGGGLLSLAESWKRKYLLFLSFVDKRVCYPMLKGVKELFIYVDISLSVHWEEDEECLWEEIEKLD